MHDDVTMKWEVSRQMYFHDKTKTVWTTTFLGSQNCTEVDTHPIVVGIFSRRHIALLSVPPWCWSSSSWGAAPPSSSGCGGASNTLSRCGLQRATDSWNRRKLIPHSFIVSISCDVQERRGESQSKLVMDRVGDLSLLKMLSHSCQQNKNEIFMEPGENISRTHWSYNWPCSDSQREYRRENRKGSYKIVTYPVLAKFAQ